MWDSKRDTDVLNSLLDSVGEGEGGMIWEHGIGTCKLPYVKWIASPGSMHETGCLGLAHWGDPEGWDGEGGERGVQDGERMSTRGWFMSMYGKTNTMLQSKNKKKKKGVVSRSHVKWNLEMMRSSSKADVERVILIDGTDRQSSKDGKELGSWEKQNKTDFQGLSI